MLTEGLTFPEAVERLAAEAGMPLPKVSHEDEARESGARRSTTSCELAAKFFEATLAGARRRQGARLSRRPRARSGDAGEVPPRLRAGRALRPQGASRQGGHFGRGHGRGRTAGHRRRHPGALRPLPRPRDVSDHRSARARHRVRRPRAREGRAGEVPQLAGDAALPQGRDALQHRAGARRRPQGRAGGRGRRLRRRDRDGETRATRRRWRRSALRSPPSSSRCCGRWPTSRCCASTATRPAGARPIVPSIWRCR